MTLLRLSIFTLFAGLVFSAAGAADKFEEGELTDANYEKLTAYLFEQRAWLKPAFGSHNIRSLAHALALAQTLKVAPGSFEIQMLYGMANPIKDVFARMGQRLACMTSDEARSAGNENGRAHGAHLP